MAPTIVFLHFLSEFMKNPAAYIQLADAAIKAEAAMKADKGGDANDCSDDEDDECDECMSEFADFMQSRTYVDPTSIQPDGSFSRTNSVNFASVNNLRGKSLCIIANAVFKHWFETKYDVPGYGVVMFVFYVTTAMVAQQYLHRQVCVVHGATNARMYTHS
jgi:hypothetical protein